MQQHKSDRPLECISRESSAGLNSYCLALDRVRYSFISCSCSIAEFNAALKAGIEERGLILHFLSVWVYLLFSSFTLQKMKQEERESERETRLIQPTKSKTGEGRNARTHFSVTVTKEKTLLLLQGEIMEKKKLWTGSNFSCCEVNGCCQRKGDFAHSWGRKGLSKHWLLGSFRLSPSRSRTSKCFYPPCLIGAAVLCVFRTLCFLHVMPGSISLLPI